MQALTQFMNGMVGRLLRVALGVVLIVLAFTALSGAGQWVLAVIGLVPIALGLSGRCMVELLPGAKSDSR